MNKTNISYKLIAIGLIISISYQIVDANYSKITEIKNIGWSKQKATGWFFYKYISPEDRDNKLNLDHEFTSQYPKLSTKWLKEAIPFYLDKAIDNPTKDNIQDYLYLQSYASQKANKFSELVTINKQGNYILDNNLEYPLAEYSQLYRNQLVDQINNKLLKKIADNSIIYFFYINNNNEVDIQAQVLSNLASEFNFNIRPISLDNINKDFNNLLPSIINRGQAESLNIPSIPSIYLFSKTANYLISAGSSDLTRLKEQILIVALKDDLITYSEWQSSRGRLFDYQSEIHNKIRDMK